MNSRHRDGRFAELRFGTIVLSERSRCGDHRRRHRYDALNGPTVTTCRFHSILTWHHLKGIGLAFASALAQTGAKKVYILGRRKEALDKAVQSIGAGQDVVVPIVCDVTNPFTVTTAVQQIEKDTGYVDVLVNNAGIGGPDHKAMYNVDSIKDLQEIMLNDWPGWASTFAINTHSVVLVSGQFLHLLDKANERRGWTSGKLEPGGAVRARKDVDGVDKADVRSSQIITVASIAAFNRFVTHGLSYGSSKAAATYLGKTLSSVLSPWGIRSNVICPGGESILNFIFLLGNA